MCLQSYGFSLIKGICSLLLSVEAKLKFTFAQSAQKTVFYVYICIWGEMLKWCWD